ncbi:MAG TPA: universal stress protein [Chloroflexia bacterium]|nr:universal stress protein [Chloroflexia bacterium]
MFKRILVCCDGSQHGRCAGEFAVSLAREQNAEIELLSVVEPLPAYMASPEVIEEECAFDTECLVKKQQHILSLAADYGIKAEAKVVRGKAAQVILDTARHDGADLIVLGRHTGHSMWVHATQHTANQLLDEAPCSVMVVG